MDNNRPQSRLGGRGGGRTPQLRAPQKRRNVTFEDDDFLFTSEPIQKNEQRLFGIKSEYMVFYIALGIVGIIVVFLGVLGAFNLFVNNANNNVDSQLSEESYTTVPPTTDIVEQPIVTLSLMGMVTNINDSSRILQIHDVNTRQNYNLNVETGTELRGRFNQLLVFSELSLGYIVQVDYNSYNNDIIRLSVYGGDNLWEHRFVTGLNVNESGNIILYEDEIYVFNSDILVINNGVPYNISGVHPLTMVTMRGIGNTVWYIEIDRGFGTVVVVNNTAVINGSVEISRETSVPLGEGTSPLDQTVQVTEGSHTLVVHGDNIAIYTRNIEVVNGETIIINLDDLQITGGYLHVNVNVEDAILTINGMQRNHAEHISLQFGELRVIAQAQGYTSFDEIITFEDHNQTLSIVLAQEQATQPNNATGSNVQTSRVDIRTVPVGANIFVDDVFVGVSPLVTDVYQGPRRITMQMPGFQSTNASIFVSPHNAPFEFELQPLPSSPQPDTPGVLSPPTVGNSSPAVVTPPNANTSPPTIGNDEPENPFGTPSQFNGNNNSSQPSGPPVTNDELTFIPGVGS